MRKTIIVVSVLAILLVSGSVSVLEDTDAADNEKYRWTEMTLYHSTATSFESAATTQYEWVYAVGTDDSMKRYLADPKNSPAPDNGLFRVEAGKTYEVYYFDRSGTFDIMNEEVALEKDPLKIVVEPNSVKKLSVNSLLGKSKNGDVLSPAYLLNLVYDDGHIDSSTHVIIDVATLNYKEGTHYEIGTQMFVPYGLFYEMDCSIVTKTFTGSPYLYVGICIVITALVALTVAVCGKRPKFD